MYPQSVTLETPNFVASTAKSELFIYPRSSSECSSQPNALLHDALLHRDRLHHDVLLLSELQHH